MGSVVFKYVKVLELKPPYQFSPLGVIKAKPKDPALSEVPSTLMKPSGGCILSLQPVTAIKNSDNNINLKAYSFTHNAPLRGQKWLAKMFDVRKTANCFLSCLIGLYDLLSNYLIKKVFIFWKVISSVSKLTLKL